MTAKRLLALVLCLLVLTTPFHGVQATEEAPAPTSEAVEVTPTPTVEVSVPTSLPEEPTPPPAVELSAPAPMAEKSMSMMGGVSLASTFTVNRNETIPLQINYNQYGATWSVSDSSILQIKKTSSVVITMGSDTYISYGVDIMGLKTGSADVYFVNAGGTTVTSCTVTVSTPITAFTLPKAEGYLPLGESENLAVTITPADADILGVTWSSSNTEAAEVDQSGHITSKATGDAIITVASDDGIHSAQYTVHVIRPTSSIDVTNPSIQLTSRTQAATINATAYPLDATNRTLTFQSSNTSIVTVNGSGTLTACGNGDATITIRSVDGFSTAQANVSVSGLVESVSADKSNVEFTRAGQTSKVTAAVAPANALVKDIAWSSDNSSIATVDSNGLITAVGAGSTVVHATAVDGGIQKDIQVKVLPLLTVSFYKLESYNGHSINRSQLFPDVKLAYGEEYTLPTPTIAGYAFVNWYKEFDYHFGEYRYPIYDNKITNTSTSESGAASDLYAKFEPIHVSGISITHFSLSSGYGYFEASASARIYPDNVADGRYVVTSSNPSVLQPTGFGVWNSNGGGVGGSFSVVGPGTTTITFQTLDGGYTASKEVTIAWDPTLSVYYELNPLNPTFDWGLYLSGSIKLVYPNYAGATKYYLYINDTKGNSTVMTLDPASGAYVDSGWDGFVPGEYYTYRLQVFFGPLNWTKISDPFNVYVPETISPPTPPPQKTITPILTTPPPSFYTPPPVYTQPPVITYPPIETLVPTPIPTATPLPQQVVISHGGLTIGAGQGSDILKAAIYPAESNTTVYWSSTNPGVVSVNENGFIYGNAVGMAIIRASAVNGLYQDCYVSVVKPGKGVVGISLSKAHVAIDEGKKASISARLNPRSPQNKTVTWSSSDPNIASVSKGMIIGHSPGTVVITATASSGVAAQCTVVIRSLAVSQVVMRKGYLAVDEGKKTSLSASVLPRNARNKTLSWSSSDPSIASVSAKGKITAHQPGTVQIIATAHNGVSSSSTLVVRSLAVSSVSLKRNPILLKVGRTTNLKATLAPKNTRYKNVTWSSSDPSIAVVSPKGSIKGINPGTVTITAMAHNGIVATCTVTVQQN